MKSFKRIGFDEIQPFMSAAKKERVSFGNPDGAEWYGIEENDNLISFFCLVKGKTSARFKSNYTIPEKRGEGCLQMFIQLAIDRCLFYGLKNMTAFCTPMSVKSHLRHGAEVVSRKGDIVYVRYTF